MNFTSHTNVIAFPRQNISSNRKAFTKPTNSASPIKLSPRPARQDLMIGLAVEGDRVKMQLMGKLNKATMPVFTEFFQTCADDGYISFLFDLADLTTIDQAGVEALVEANNQLHELGGQATISNPDHELHQQLLENFPV